MSKNTISAQRKKRDRKGQQGKGAASKRTSQNNNNNNNARVKQIAAAYSRPQNTRKLKQSITSNGSRNLKWKEYVQDIAGSVGFVVTSFKVQPGLPALFAWLASQAVLYQEYEFIKLKFCFETEKGSSTNGKVMFAFQPDVLDPLPVTKQEMLENMYKSSGAPWECFQLEVPADSLKALGRWRFTRAGAVANSDLKTYDVGQLLVATQGMADTTAVGEMYVEYEIQLRTPVMSVASATLANSAFITGVSTTQQSFMGTTPTITGGLDVTATVNTITFNSVGQFLVYISVIGTTIDNAPLPGEAGTAVISYISSGSISTTAAVYGATVIVSARGQTAIFDWDPEVASLTSSTTRIARYTTA